MNKVILLDMDGVFCDFVKGFHTLAEKHRPELHALLKPIEEQDNYYIHDHIEDKLIHSYGEEISNHTELFGILEPLPGSIEGVKLLDKLAKKFGYQVIICTAPHTTNLNCYSLKAHWIKKYLGAEWLERTLIVRDKTLIDALVLIDDRPYPVGNYTPSWKHVVVPYKYNLKQQKTNYVFKGWSEKSLKNLIKYVTNVELEAEASYDYEVENVKQ